MNTAMTALRPTIRSSLFAVLVALSAGACSRSLPPAWSSASPVSIEAEPAPQAAVHRSLDEDPPLPGATTEAWEGLDRPAESHTGHGGHHHGH